MRASSGTENACGFDSSEPYSDEGLPSEVS
jgi:hypothetical protein